MPDDKDQQDDTQAEPERAEPEGFPASTPVKDMTPEQELAYWRHQAREHERRWQTAEKTDPSAAKTASELRELRRKAAEYDKYVESQKTELEKAAARAEKAEKALAERDAADKAKELRDEVAKERGIAAGVLRGSTREEIEAHADEIATAFKVEKPKAPPADGQGAVGGSVHDGEDRSAEDIVDAATSR